MGNLQLASHDADFLQAAEDLFGHAFGEIHKAVIFSNIHMPDVTSLESCLVRDSPDNVARLHAVQMAHFNPESLVRDVVLTTTLPRGRLASPVVAGLLALATRSVFTRLALCTRCVLTLLAFRSRSTLLGELRVVPR